MIPEQDWVARREAQERLAVSLQKLQEKVLPLLQVSIESEAHVLKPSSAVVPVVGHRSSAALLSAVCDEVYGQTPRIPNEMLSRRELTSQGAKARRMLIEAIADRSMEELCGMTKGYGPERAMFDALVGLHELQKPGRGLCWPAETTSLSPVYAYIDSFFRGALQTKRPLSDLWAQLKAPPFGLKDGPVPVLLSHYLLLHDDQVGLYEDGRFVPGIDTAVIERLAKNPETFHCSSFALEGLRKTYLRHLLDALLIECPRGVTLLYAVKQVLKKVRQWPAHSRHTQTLSAQAKALRKACLGAKEPDQLMFVDLPRAVGVESLTKVTVEHVVPAISSAMREIGGRFDLLLTEMEEAIGKALNSIGISVRGDVAPRAARLKDQILDPRLRALALALADQELEADRDWVQRVGLSLLGRAPSEWIDSDVQRFHVALSELAPAFRRLEALHFNHQGDGQAGFKAVRVGVTTSEGEDHQQVISIPDSQIPALESFVQRILKEASQAFGDAGAQLVLAQWAQQAIGDASASVDQLGERRHLLNNMGARGHG